MAGIMTVARGGTGQARALTRIETKVSEASRLSLELCELLFASEEQSWLEASSKKSARPSEVERTQRREASNNKVGLANGVNGTKKPTQTKTRGSICRLSWKEADSVTELPCLDDSLALWTMTVSRAVRVLLGPFGGSASQFDL